MNDGKLANGFAFGEPFSIPWEKVYMAKETKNASEDKSPLDQYYEAKAFCDSYEAIQKALERVNVTEEKDMFSGDYVALNLGCFKKPFPKPFTNVDVRPYPETLCDVCDDVVKLDKFQDNSVDLITAVHVFEHFKRDERLEALKNWNRVLKSGGIVRISVPDFEAIAAHYFYWKDLNSLQHMLHGSAKHDFDYHFVSYDFDTLAKLLQDNGFESVYTFDWSQTYPWNFVDDFTQAYDPPYHKNMTLSNGKEVNLGGRLMSLNIEATKA